MRPAPAFCHRCERKTSTAFLPLSSGHIGNACDECHALRKGKPYAPRIEYEQIRTDAHQGQGSYHENQSSSS